MGNLHDGHMKLVDERARADVKIVSIFVNPMQLTGRTIWCVIRARCSEDCEKLNKRSRLCLLRQPLRKSTAGWKARRTGCSRPLYHAGRRQSPGPLPRVSTIVSKLFNPIQPISPALARRISALALIRKWWRI
ncbi:pantoate--beta-alanine ligase [Salmonella enterica subsp. enterica]|nr:pantoate--beta-alanine ligase [Salmonella enterica subsp. enterica]